MEELDKRPLFSIVAIMKNEANTLPKLFSGLTEYQARGGEVVILDTGSTDNSAEIARNFGAIVHEVGEKFITVINSQLAGAINKEFVVEGEEDIVKAGNKLFDFAAARNYVSSLATNNFIVTLDCDEKYSRFDIDIINDLISQGYEQLEYNFVYAHDAVGNPAVQFIQSKAFDRRKLKWVNKVHEVLHGDAKRIYVAENVILLEHFQEQGKEHRSNYLTGLGTDSYENPSNDRNLFYCAREMMYHGRPKSAIKAFMRHQKFNGWDAERAQGLIYIGDCYGILNEPEKQLEYYHKGFDAYPKRREALIRIASYYRHRNNPHATAAYANATLVIPQTGFYADAMNEYRETPHEFLYWACNLMGDKEAAKWHFHQAYSFQPDHPKYIADSKEILGFQLSDVQGWMTLEEQVALFNEAKKANVVVEIGSWKSRSTQALLQGCPGIVYACDTWMGSADVQDLTNTMAKQEDVFEIFKENTKQYNNLKIVRKTSLEASKEFAPKSINFCFIDAGHSLEECMADALAWWPLVADGGTLAFHDYQQDVWMGVVKCVDTLFGKPDELYGSIAIIRKDGRHNL